MEKQSVGPFLSANAFEALFDDPKVAANLTARSEIAAAIRDRVGEWGMSQQEAASRLGINRPRLNDLLRGKIDKFSLDALVSLADHAGYEVTVSLKDRSAA